jgi:hypothetical protein
VKKQGTFQIIKNRTDYKSGGQRPGCDFQTQKQRKQNKRKNEIS